MAVAFSTNDSVVMQREVLQHSGSEIDDVFKSFEIQRCVNWIQDKQLAKVALQFPDSLLQHSPDVVVLIEEQIGRCVYVLGDTSYGECCVDEVAAEHIGADSIIHFGPACLTPTLRLPTLYIFTVRSLEIKRFQQALESQFSRDDHLAIVYDIPYDEAFKDFSDEDINVPFCLCPPHPPAGSPDEDLKVECGRLWPPDINSDNDKWKIVYVGTNERLRTLLNFTFPNHALFIYDPSKQEILENAAHAKGSKLLMRRYVMIEKTKDADRIGILVGTLGVSRYGLIIDQVREVIKKAGKKAYTFLVGKPNVPKLANFPEVDVFVLIACPENSLLDSKEFLKPVITPFELDVALNANRQWSGAFYANFQHLLPGGKSFVEFEEEEEPGDFSLITGKVRVKEKPLQKEDNALMVQETQLSLLHTKGGGEFLSQRSWQGLEQKLGQTEIVKAVEGQKGIAWGYANEGQE